MKVIGGKEIKREKEDLSHLKAMFLKDNLLMENYMDKELWSQLKL